MKQTRKRRSNISREFRLPANVMHEEAWEDSGPNMKLSRAFIVVLVLHIVAVGGLAAFNLFDNKKDKTGESTKLPEKPLVPVTRQQDVAVVQPTVVSQQTVELASTKAVKVEKEMSTSYFALQYGLTEDKFLELNRDTPISSGNLLRGETVFVPSGAVIRSSVDDLPEAPVVMAPLEKPAPPEIAVATPVRQPKPRSKYTPPKKPTVKKTKPRTASSSSYKVKKGDTLYSIARRNGVSVSALTRANGISNAKKLSIGKVLKIPK